MQDISLSPELFEGTVSLETRPDGLKPWRIPFDAIDLFPPRDGLPVPAEHTSGVRLRFQTNTSRIVLNAAAPGETAGYFDVSADGNLLQSVPLAPDETKVVFSDLPADDNVLELWLPQDRPTTLHRLEVDDGAYLKSVSDPRVRWLTYGSSITHCARAFSPARTWPAIVARRVDLNVTALGYSGQCHLDIMVARMMGQLPADLISLKVGINISSIPTLNQRTFQSALIGFVLTLRDYHPDIPIAVISPITAPRREQPGGESAFPLAEMRQHVEEAVTRLIDAGDSRLCYFSGLDVLGHDEAGQYLIEDMVHPGPEGIERMGENFLTNVLSAISIP